ncbi:nucleotidyltransferase [Bacillus wiedmannii]|uniref:SMODS domain-containing nucleotidyltransferase n=1 Tax=Bacillus wiedmannii TaxID=1890302 RepID=UPI000BF9481E|nr:nucleotidyltransferase [Bacillus wiedmannii]PGD07605.1 nucleotidyltransferase [Bacillus wiedmannii]
MKISDYFKLFIANLSLNKGRKEKIDGALSTWEVLLSEDKEFNEKFKGFYSQGSYATKTAIRPSKDAEFDVDVILLLDVKKEDSKEFFNWVAERIKSKKTYEGKIKPQDRCIRIDYAGDFHVDIVPARTTYGDSILIPSKKEGNWVKTNPAGFKKWCDKKHIEHNEKFRSMVKILKYWRDENVGDNTAPKSILLTTLVGKYMIAKSSYAETLVATLDNMVTELDELIKDTPKDDAIKISNPSLEDENLARDWTVEKCRIFRDKLKNFHSKSLEALNDSNKESSIEKWQAIFGKKKFPNELPDGAKMAQAVAKGSIFVNSQGILNHNSQGVTIKEHRFFGIDKTNEEV